jgi:hypothetical protein
MYLRRDTHILFSYLRRDNTLHTPTIPKFPNESVSPQGYPYHITQLIRKPPAELFQIVNIFHIQNVTSHARISAGIPSGMKQIS